MAISFHKHPNMSFVTNLMNKGIEKSIQSAIELPELDGIVTELSKLIFDMSEQKLLALYDEKTASFKTRDLVEVRKNILTRNIQNTIKKASSAINDSTDIMQRQFKQSMDTVCSEKMSVERELREARQDLTHYRNEAELAKNDAELHKKSRRNEEQKNEELTEQVRLLKADLAVIDATTNAKNEEYRREVNDQFDARCKAFQDSCAEQIASLQKANRIADEHFNFKYKNLTDSHEIMVADLNRFISNIQTEKEDLVTDVERHMETVTGLKSIIEIKNREINTLNGKIHDFDKIRELDAVKVKTTLDAFTEKMNLVVTGMKPTLTPVIDW